MGCVAGTIIYSVYIPKYTGYTNQNILSILYYISIITIEYITLGYRINTTYLSSYSLYTTYITRNVYILFIYLLIYLFIYLNNIYKPCIY